MNKEQLKASLIIGFIVFLFCIGLGALHDMINTMTVLNNQNIKLEKVLIARK
jgi:uncharacterized transporter YbjL